jgi:hypothetical protein
MLDQRLMQSEARCHQYQSQTANCTCSTLKEELMQVKQLYKESVDQKEGLRGRIRELEE